MAISATELQQQLDRLDRMIASGVLTTETDGNRLTYRSQAELLQARDWTAQQLQAVQGVVSAPRQTRAVWCDD